MTHSAAAPRLALWRNALILVALATSSLAFVASASAAVLTPPLATVDPNGLATAIITANTNTDPSNIIILANGRYAPIAPLPAITKPLTITGDHAFQAAGTPNGAIRVDGTNQNPPDSDLFTVNSGVSVTLESFLVTTAANNNFAVVRDNGNVTIDNMSLDGNNGIALAVSLGATATVNESTISDNAQVGIATQGTLTLNNSTVANNVGGGISKTAGTFRLNNTIVSNNDPFQFGIPNCDQPAAAQDHSLDNDGSCNVAIVADPLLAATDLLGGPTQSTPISAGSPAIGAANPAICPTVDQRFFVHTSAGCDIGGYQLDGVQQTTGPSCAVTNLILGPPKQQQVTATDTRSGMGLEAGPANDPVNPADAISGLTITNGTVAFTPFTFPSRSGLVLTATKTNQASVTQWSFTAKNWAGVTTFCT